MIRAQGLLDSFALCGGEGASHVQPIGGAGLRACTQTTFCLQVTQVIGVELLPNAIEGVEGSQQW